MRRGSCFEDLPICVVEEKPQSHQVATLGFAFHQQSTRVPLFSTTLQHLISSLFDNGASPGGAELLKESATNAGDKDTWVWSGSKIPGKGNSSNPVFLSGKLHGQSSLAGFIGSEKSNTTEHTHTFLIITIQTDVRWYLLVVWFPFS